MRSRSTCRLAGATRSSSSMSAAGRRSPSAASISDYIPNPTFERIGRPGAQEQYFKQGNPENKTPREIVGRGIDCPPAFRNAVDAARPHGRAGHRLRADDADARQPHRGAHAGRSRPLPRRDPRVQPVDGRGVAVRVRGPHLRGAVHHPVPRRPRRGGARVGRSSAAPRRCSCGPAPAWGHDGPRSFGAPGVRPVLAARRGERDRSSALHVSRLRLRPLLQRVAGRGAPRWSTSGDPNPFKQSKLFNHRPIEDMVTR